MSEATAYDDEVSTGAIEPGSATGDDQTSKEYPVATAPGTDDMAMSASAGFAPAANHLGQKQRGLQDRARSEPARKAAK